MKTISIITALFFATLSLSAETKNYTNIEEAAKVAIKEKKKIFVLFTGSDWCPPCMKLEKYIISSVVFQKYLLTDALFVFLDFPKRKELSVSQTEYNKKLANKFAIRGYPTYVLLDPNNLNEPLYRASGYDDAVTAEEFTKTLKESASK